MMEGGVWKVRPCCPRVQSGRGGPLCLYCVSLVVSAIGDEDVWGRQLIHRCGLGEVAGDGDLGGVVLAGGGVGDDVVGRPFVMGGVENGSGHLGCVSMCRQAASDPRGNLLVTWGVYLCADKPPLADIILPHPPDLT